MAANAFRHSVITGAFWVGIDRWASQILNLTIYVVLARMLGPTSFGLTALAWVYLSFVQMFASQGFETALIQRKDLEDAHLQSAFWVTLSISTSLTLATAILAGPLSGLLGEPQLSEILRCLSVILILRGLSTVPEAILQRGMTFRSLTMRSLVGTFAGGVVGLMMAWSGLGVWSLVGQQLTSALIGTAMIWRSTAWRPSFQISKTHLRDLYGYSISMMGNHLVWFASQRADQSLIGVNLGVSSLGPYALAVRLTDLLVELITAPIVTVALPAFSRLQQERQRLQEAFYKTTEMVGTVSVPAFMGLSMLAPTIIPGLFGSKWSASVPLLQMLTVYGVLRATLCCVHPLMLAVGRPGLYFWLLALYSGIAVGLCLLAVKWGPTMVATAVSMAMLLNSAAFMVVCRSLVGISVFELLARCRVPLIASGCMMGLMLILKSLTQDLVGELAFSIAVIPVAIGAYIIVIMLLRPELMEEIGQVIWKKLHFSTQS